jgi:sugar/nucleoside kinase (ribokinase family)
VASVEVLIPAGYRRIVQIDDASTDSHAAPSAGPDTGPRLDVVAVGNALVDVLASAVDADLDRLGLVKGTMALVDLARSEEIYGTLGPTTAVSGGSAANTAAGVAALGGRAAFLGRVADDEMGKAFTHDIRSAGVAFDPRPTPSVPGREVTGHCLVLVTDDAERTMCTHLGVAADFRSGDLHPGHLSSTNLVYLEGYLWEQPSAIAAMREAMDLAHDSDAAVALSLSDPFCVQRHQAEFLELLHDDLDLVFANEDEILLLFGATQFEAAIEAVAETGVLAAVTRGPAGCVVVTASGPVTVPAAPVDRVVDTTGAGDLFAAGFLYGITNGLSPADSARLGGVCAAAVISPVGARPQDDLRALALSAGLFG